MKFAFALLAVCLAGAPALAAGAAKSPAPDEETGELNPQGLSIQYWAAKATQGDFDPHMCMYGVFLDKTGQHDEARRIFERCANEGNLNAMPWMSFLEENGYDRPADPARAAEWDRKLADKGSTLGQFNYGLDLLRGHGVTQDSAAGRAMIDKASAGGDRTARELARHDYDPDSVTPTADLAHYRQPQF